MINHRSFPSLCIGDNHGTVLEFERTETVIYSPLISRPALCLPLVTLAVTFKRDKY